MPIISVVAAVQVTEALKLLTAHPESLHQSLMQFDVWHNEWRRIGIGERAPDCLTCGLGRFETLDADDGEFAAVLCGRHAVQVSPSHPVQVDLAALSQKLESAGEVRRNDYLLRFRTGDYELTVFQDARSIIRGTDDIATARSLYARYVGN
jgi:adenylyltransferase/sulfurtransferase